MFAETYAKYYDLLNQNKPYKKDCNFIYKWAGKPKSIFDIGAGTANYWKYFPKGITLIGIDKSLDMIAYSDNRVFYGDIFALPQSGLPFCPDFDCVIAIFDVINYIPNHTWWKRLPLKKGGYFIFDIWDKKKVDRDGFKQTIKGIGGIIRIINPLSYNGKEVKLNITITNKDFEETELHTMYVYSEADIKKFCGKKFEIVDIKHTKDWQCWYKLERL